MSNRHRRRRYMEDDHYDTFHRASDGFRQRRRRGFGMNLYRNTRDRKIAGVCAGLADHFNVDHWVVRLLAIGALIFFNSLAFFGYLIAWVVLSPRPKRGPVEHEYRYDETTGEDRPVNMFRYRASPSERLRTARERMDDLLNRTSDMESYVTSRRYELDKEFSKI